MHGIAKTMKCVHGSQLDNFEGVQVFLAVAAVVRCLHNTTSNVCKQNNFNETKMAPSYKTLRGFKGLSIHRHILEKH